LNYLPYYLNKSRLLETPTLLNYQNLNKVIRLVAYRVWITKVIRFLSQNFGAALSG